MCALPATLGRDSHEAAVVLDDPNVSRLHARIEVAGNEWVIVDLGSTNGTYINDVARGRITRSPLRDGDVVIVGEPDCLSLQIKLG